METWRLLETWEGEPGFNLALDEALLAASVSTPCLRFYTWKPAALSLGYFQRYADVSAARTAEHVVRRFTGGGAIHHARELTFSIAAPLAHPLYAGPVRGSYERVHALLARALSELGVAAEPREGAALASDRTGTGMCFHESSPLDLAVGGRKLVGSAQRRSGGRVLHHGSIKLGVPPAEQGAAGLAELGVEISAERLAALVAAAFARELGLRLEPSDLAEAERARALARAPHFASADFLRRR